MSMNDVIDTLHDFLVKWLTDAGFRDDYDGDLEEALEDNDFDDVDYDTLRACLPLVAEELPLSYQQSIYEYLNAGSDVDNGGYFEVNQGGGGAEGIQGGGGHHGGRHHDGGGESDLDEVVRHIYNIQHVSETNYSYIDDSGDVSTTITALGDVDFDQNVATNGGVAAGGDVEGVNTGTNSGIVAGDDVEDAEVYHVTGDGNVTGKVDSGANVVTGNAGVAAASGAYVATEDVNVGGTQYDVDAEEGSAVNFGSGSASVDNSVDNSVRYDDSFNTDNSTNDSFNTDLDVKVKDSFQDNSDNSDNSTTDNSTNTDVDLRVRDSFQDNDDNSVNTDVEVEDSFQDNDDLSRYSDVDVEDSFQANDESVTRTYTETNTDIDAELDVEYTEDNDLLDVDSEIDDINV